MHRSFRFGMDKMDNLSYPNFQPEEIDLLLNQAQERFVKQRYGTTNTKRTSFEETEKRTEDLKEILETSQLIPDKFVGLTQQTARSKENLASNTYTVSLTSLDHWFTIWDKAIISCPTCNTSITLYTNDTGDQPAFSTIDGIEVEVRPISHLEYDKYKKDAFKAPDYTKILKVMYKDKVELIPMTGCLILYYIIRYVRKPIQVNLSGNIDCELSEHTHQEVTDLAIQIALEGIEAKRTQTFTPIINNQNE